MTDNAFIDKKHRDTRRLYLKHSDARFLFIIYAVFIIIGSLISVIEIKNYSTAENKELSAIIAGISMSVAGSSIFYARKLYQACINYLYTFPESSQSTISQEEKTRRLGTLAFFILRPLFGIVFSIFVYVLWRLSISASDESSLSPSPGFLYITISLGFLSGFLAGRVLTLIEGYGTNRLGPLLGKDG